MAHVITSKEIEIKNRHMKTVLFLSIMGIMFILVAIVMVQTTSQQNSMNSRAGKNILKNADDNEKKGEGSRASRINKCKRGCLIKDYQCLIDCVTNN